MAEFCLECWNKMNGINDSPKKYILSKELELCEGCAQWKTVVVVERKAYYCYILHRITFPLRIIFKTIYVLLRLLILPYLIYKYNKRKGE